MDRSDELLPELTACKRDHGLDFLFLAVVNIVLMRSNLLMCGLEELTLAQHAFTDGVVLAPGVMDLGGRVSRKKEFIPPITNCVKGFHMPDIPKDASEVAARWASEVAAAKKAREIDGKPPLTPGFGSMVLE